MANVRPPRWHYSPQFGALVRYKEDNSFPGVAREADVEIPFHEVPALVQALEESGLLKPRLDERLRTEDLKITHRLMDLLDKSIGIKSGGA